MSAGAVKTRTTTTQKTLPDGKVQTIIKKEITSVVDGEEKTEVQEETIDGATGLFDDVPPPDDKPEKVSFWAKLFRLKVIPQSLIALRAEALKVHNEYRERHGVEALKEDKNLDKIAQEWAEKIANGGAFEHRPDCPHGECIYSGLRTTGAAITGKEVVDQWYNECKTANRGTGYDYQCNEFNPRTGHFTQVVWKGTQRIGIGYKRTDEGRVYVVANYDPAGNVRGKFTENVLTPKTDEEIEAAKEENRAKEEEQKALTVLAKWNRPKPKPQT